MKDYKKILEGLVNIINNTEKSDIGFANICTFIGENCPELKESEDEQHRKWILECLYDGLRKSDEQFKGQFKSAIAWLEKQGEQKHADKIEPKFKVGDWVIDKQGIVHQVANVVENVTNHTYGYDIVGGGYFNDNTEGVRLWNISDAKDGDVLVNGSNIFIFHFTNDTRLMGYCHVNTDDGRLYDDIGRNECFCLIDAVVNPATKEQRDKLDKAMTDAGWAFMLRWIGHLRKEKGLK